MPAVPTPTAREIAEAKRQFKAGLKLKSKGNLDAAFDKFSSASELDPHNVSYITARELAREELAMDALKQGNKAMLNGNEIVAMAEFRRALEYDPTNDYALQRLRDSIPEDDTSAQAESVVSSPCPSSCNPGSRIRTSISAETLARCSPRWRMPMASRPNLTIQCNSGECSSTFKT